jgi:hypothetical protein
LNLAIGVARRLKSGKIKKWRVKPERVSLPFGMPVRCSLACRLALRCVVRRLAVWSSGSGSYLVKALPATLFVPETTPKVNSQGSKINNPVLWQRKTFVHKMLAGLDFRLF